MSEEDVLAKVLRAAGVKPEDLYPPNSLLAASPLPPDLKAAATVIARGIAERANQHLGRVLYPAVERMVVSEVMMMSHEIRFVLRWTDATGSNDNLRINPGV